MNATDERRGATPAVELAVALVLLAASSALSCVLAAAWLHQYVGPVPVPLTVVAAGAWSLVLVRVARQWSDRSLVAAFPALVWILTLVVIDLGPAGDMPVPPGLRGLALLVAGGLIPLWVAFTGPVLRGDLGGGDAHRR